LVIEKFSTMAARYNPKTLAKTIGYMAYHAPSEYGLFWDPDGTMPWKELYWALQEDASLRFVRQTHIRELNYLGLDLPFILDANRLRLRPDLAQPAYPPADRPPERLFFACLRKHYSSLLERGITAAHRPYVALCADRELALRLGKRRDAEPILVEVMAAGASIGGEPIRSAGEGLYLVQSVPLRYLVLPLIRAERYTALTSRKKVELKPSRTDLSVSPGSFFVDIHRLHGQFSAISGDDQPGKKKGKRKADWKRDAKKERHKRKV
jgi:putative RNA 2'-phosphotransferase